MGIWKILQNFLELNKAAQLTRLSPVVLLAAMQVWRRSDMTGGRMALFSSKNF